MMDEGMKGQTVFLCVLRVPFDKLRTGFVVRDLGSLGVLGGSKLP